MGKKSKKLAIAKKPVQLSYPIPVPVAASRDELLMMLDDELVSRLASLQRDLSFVTSNCSLTAKPWEQEISYFQREIDWRQERCLAHETWLKKQGSQETF